VSLTFHSQFHLCPMRHRHKGNWQVKNLSLEQIPYDTKLLLVADLSHGCSDRLLPCVFQCIAVHAQSQCLIFVLLKGCRRKFIRVVCNEKRPHIVAVKVLRLVKYFARRVTSTVLVYQALLKALSARWLNTAFEMYPTVAPNTNEIWLDWVCSIRSKRYSNIGDSEIVT